MIQQHLSDCVEQQARNFSNGRLVRNLYDDLVMKHAKRVVVLPNPTKQDLSLLSVEDFV